MSVPGVAAKLAAEGAAQAVDRERLWRYLMPFTTGVRLSGSDAERIAFDEAERVLRGLGLRVRRLDHEGYVSLPGRASLVLGHDPIDCITHSLSAPTDGTTARVVDASGDVDVHGSIALARGLASPGAVHALVARGAIGAIFINAEERYEMCVSPVWGSPDSDAMARLPGVPVVSVTAEWEARLLEAVTRGEQVTIRSEVDTGWRTIPLLEATLEAPTGDGSLVLFSGHIDAWHYGAMDNGGANATMLEVATVMAERRSLLRRDLRFLFWSGHSHGRYAGSQYYADQHYLELRDRALVHVNIDSVGGVGATVLTEAPSMPETFELAAAAIASESGQRYRGVRFERAGDQSFWGHGVSSLFMGLSEQERSDSVAGEAFARMFGASRAGGFGWWWHTPQDTIDKLDPRNLERDARIYARSIDLLCTAPIAPLRYAASVSDMLVRLEGLRERLGDRLDLTPALERCVQLRQRLDALEPNWPGFAPSSVWTVQKRLARALVPLGYVAGPRHQHDPALAQPPMPLLAPIERLGRHTSLEAQRHERVAARRALNGALDLLDEALAALPATTAA